MAITTELVGKLGGGKVSTIDINFANPNSNGTYDVVTVPVPSGVPHLVALEIKTMESTSSSTNSSTPKLFFNTIDKGSYLSNGIRGAVAVSDTPVTIRAQRNGSVSNYSAAFTGTVYYCPLGS